MDVGTYLKAFEGNLNTYSGDDPLDPWDRFVQFLEGKLPLEERKGMSVVLDRLVERFMEDERYHNDPRYVDHCIKCASFYDDPIKVYSYVHSQGIGTRVATLYIAWAQQFEKIGQLSQAEAVYQRAVENQAKPVDTVLQHYRKFQSEVLKLQTGSTDVPRNPLQNSQLANQQSRPREIFQPQCKDPPQFPDDRTVRIISKSENNPSDQPKAQSGPVQQISMYCVSELVCEDSEYSFEELRALRYWGKCKQQAELQEIEEGQRKARESEEEVRRMQELLNQLDSKSPIQPAESQAPNRPYGMLQEDQALASAALRPEQAPLPARPAAALGSRLSLSHRPAPTFRPSLALQPRLDLGARRKSEPPTSALGGSASSLRSLLPPGRLCPLEEAEASRCEVDSPHQISGSARRSAQPEGPSSSLPPAVALVTTASSLQPWQTSLLHHQTSDGAESTGTLPIHRQASPAEVPCGALVQRSHCVLSRAEPVHIYSSSFQQPLEEGDHDVSKHGEDEESYREGANNVSLVGQGNHSHVTPNNSLGYVQATPSRVLPSPTVHTREALDLIMDMFQAPTFVADGLSQIAEEGLNLGHSKNDKPAVPLPSAASAFFTIFQDEDDKENGGQVAGDKRKPLQTRAEIPLPEPSQQNETPVGVDFMTDVTMWGSRYHSLAACPNSTRDFALSAHLVSTPFHLGAPHPLEQESDQENDAPTVFGSDENHPFTRQLNKLSPIIEQSPVDDKLTSAQCTAGAQGTIVGEALAPAEQQLHQSQSQTGYTSSLCAHPLAALSFPDHTVAPTEEEGASKMASTTPKSSWTIYQSPEKPLQDPSKGQSFLQEMEADVPTAPERVPAAHSFLSKTSFHAPQTENLFAESQDLFHRSHHDVPMSPEPAPRPPLDVAMSPAAPASRPIQDIPMSPDPAATFDWFKLDSPVADPEPYMDHVFMKSSTRAAHRSLSTSLACSRQEVPMPASPAKRPEMCLDVPMSPEQTPAPHVLPAGTPAPHVLPAAPFHLVSDPWDDELITSLLSRLATPLTSYPNVTTWQFNLPTVSPKMTTTMAGQSFRVDFVLGQGAFATVYQATNLTTSEKLFLKVQKPANPWEYYINMQLNLRLKPSVRHLFNNIHSAHLFRNGSILIGDLHNCGTLLNAINLYKSRSEKVMPQALVLYFTSCILHMVDQLHSARIVHADIKPDNFLLGETFLENECFDPENCEHGLALIDLGQSIDMSLFPEGTAFTAKCMTSAFQCTEMLSGRPWNYQTDYFGIAGTVYCMIFGSYMQVKNENGEWKPSGTFKRNPHSELWQEFFHALLNVPDCGSLLCLRRLRSRVHTELQKHYGTKLRGLKNRLVVQLLEARSSRR
ncbi:mitotic checkpoint serine/threonine-protein kinase BUB1 isoform X2 [Clupea harengus]|uniref:Mitotic checkpoint serine/threonine-protein kinase BUB1 isoform X2 n=1 Tax=Clupea harengus TaxID=7950 RepID=A0A8M1KC13_CLUHA|nr:mitotic checkpoint serine/threonine-protein kinase BUB1 isoform X2 [Clupea harengus]